MRRSDRNFTKIPDGKLGIIALEAVSYTHLFLNHYDMFFLQNNIF